MSYTTESEAGFQSSTSVIDAFSYRNAVVRSVMDIRTLGLFVRYAFVYTSLAEIRLVANSDMPEMRLMEARFSQYGPSEIRID